MAEHWIPTRKAIDIIKNEDALRERLASGALRARAERQTTGSKTLLRVAIDRNFWQHDIYYDPTFDWQVGDCRSTINGHETAITGVTVEVSGLLEMVPFEQRGLVARSLSVAGHVDWLTSQDAMRLVQTAKRANLTSPERVIIEQA